MSHKTLRARSVRHALEQYAYPLRIVCFNAIEGWSRDATSDVADALSERIANSDAEVSQALQDFIQAYGTRPFNLQLALPLPLRILA
ncbi:hypothetical protein ML401_23720 [Bradyrhizobium sp. 62B]|uniref:hypothetical protein n=1 Tax=Bradyrhizobium sp. 62B TaxID=2898442 RepID=UPI00255816B8|nr:hypothetical protein ML401_23720 [Bradyrhizobium sp. 62B]